MELTTLSALFGAAQRGERPAAQALFGALYDELHRLTRRELARYAGPVSVGATTLLRQVYIEMAAREGQDFPIAADSFQMPSVPWIDASVTGLLPSDSRRQVFLQHSGMPRSDPQ